MKKNRKSLWLGLLLLCITTRLFAAQFLSAEQAFNLTLALRSDNRGMIATFTIRPGYHLYKKQIKFQPSKKDGVSFDKIQYPIAHQFNDGHEVHDVYEGITEFNIPIQNAGKPTFHMNVLYQGCSSTGICYPPVTKSFLINLTKGTVVETDHQRTSQKTAVETPQSKVEDILIHGNIFQLALSFLFLGLLLSFTPCVLPMVPILSGIIIGHRHPVGSKTAFFLSLSYVLGMAFVYAVAGFFIGMAGAHIQGALQSPWIISFTSLIFVILALSLFDIYDLHLPSALQHRVHELSHKQHGGTYFGVFIMGGIATLIVSPCVSAPLVAALAYIGQTGNAFVGMFALFMLGIGMGIPLLIIGTSGGKLLPKAGPWMNAIKYFFGVLLIAMAIWMLSRVIPAPMALALWGSLLIITAVYMHAFDGDVQSGWLLFWRGWGLVMMISGTILLVGAAMGEKDPLNPLAGIGRAGKPIETSPFTRLVSHALLQQKLSEAKEKQQGVILDYYANWCTTCHTIEEHVFQDPAVHQAWSGLKLLQADVTVDNPSTRAMQDQYQVYAPPTIIFIDSDGEELTHLRVVGDISKADFLKRLSDFNHALSERD